MVVIISLSTLPTYYTIRTILPHKLYRINRVIKKDGENNSKKIIVDTINVNTIDVDTSNVDTLDVHTLYVDTYIFEGGGVCQIDFPGMLCGGDYII